MLENDSVMKKFFEVVKDKEVKLTEEEEKESMSDKYAYLDDD